MSGSLYDYISKAVIGEEYEHWIDYKTRMMLHEENTYNSVAGDHDVEHCCV